MARVVFTANLNRYVECPPREVAAGTVRQALEAVFRDNPTLRGYVLDDQGQLRRHVVVFIDGKMIQDRSGLSDAIDGGSELYVMQSLSGG